MASDQYWRFIYIFLVTSGLFCLTVIGFNLMMDPYGIYHSPIFSLNRLKPEIESHRRLTTAIEIIRSKSKHIAFSTVRGSKKNIHESIKTIPEGTLEEVYAYFEHSLHNQHKLESVELYLDLFAFSKSREKGADFSAFRLHRTKFTSEDLFRTLFSLNAIKSSLITLMTNIGLRKTDTSLPCGKQDIEDFELNPRAIDFLRKIIDKCREKGIILTITLLSQNDDEEKHLSELQHSSLRALIPNAINTRSTRQRIQTEHTDSIRDISQGRDPISSRLDILGARI